MRIVLKHIIHNILEKRLRSIIVLLTILLSTLILFIGLSLNEIINNTYTTMLQGSYGTANVVVSKKAEDGIPFYESTKLDIADIHIDNRLDMIQAIGKSFLNDEHVTVTLYGLDPQAAFEMQIVDILTGSQELEGNSVIISQKTSSTYDLVVGDRIDVSSGGNSYDFRIAAISKSDGIYYSEMGDILLLAQPDQVMEMLGGGDMVSSTLLEVPGTELDTAITSLAETNQGFTIQKSSAADTIMRDEQTFQTVMMLAIIIIVLISAYVISSLSKLIITERMPVLATFRSVGASKGMMNRVLILEFFMYGVIGAVLGIILAVFLLPFAADLFNEYKEYGMETVVEYNMIYLIISVVFGMMFPALVSFLRIVRTNAKPLKDVLFNTSSTLEKRSRWTVILGIVFFFIAFVINGFNKYDDMLLSIVSILLLFISIVLLMPLLLSGFSKLLSLYFKRSRSGELGLGIKNIANNKIVANNVSMIIVVFLLLIMVGIASEGINYYVTKAVSKDFDVVVTLSDRNDSLVHDIVEMDGVADAYLQAVSLGKSSINGSEGIYGVFGVDDFNEIGEFYDGINYLEIDEERLISLDNPVILDDYYMNKYDIHIGDSVQIQPINSHYENLENAGSVTFIVAGSMESAGFASSRDSALIPMEIYEDYFEPLFYELTLKQEEGIVAEELKENIADYYSNYSLEVATFDERIEAQKSTIDTLINGITIIIGLGMMVGILGISNNLMVSFNQRKKEYAILYSVCMSKGQIVKMIFAETLLTFITVAVIGLFGGFAINFLLTKFFYAIGMVTDFHFTFKLYGILCGVVAILLALSTLSLVRKVFKLHIMKELRYE
ncbi:FtsX-like permease family protein [Ornithinibacillus massiliensis]|uniref:FtsX-like permease family protein n=1 Tax=Ornithinibacillus massiliensis TaxID=1944633 RepID=A0ABS5MHY5_9BACI|nr:FtsX-like permease family protein [Ornithinibacillus massiliensis]MBS3681956.1 FtsX-like permease family protein [Ornithinibacillus massiliensis]